MKKKYIYSIVLLAAILASLFFWITLTPKITLKLASFDQLPYWKTTPVKYSFTAFRLSCQTFLKQSPEKWVGNDQIPIQIKDWQPACRAAMTIDKNSEQATKLFFDTWFTPVEFYKGKPIHGLFTGYFMPLLQGSLVQTPKYNIPIYGLPSNLVTANLGLFKPDLKNRKIVGRVVKNSLLPFFTRKEINQGAIKHQAPVLFWIESPIDRVFLEIEGSGVVDLTDGRRIYVGYAGENGAPYTSIASILIKQGVLTRETASSQHIKQYFKEHPEEINLVLDQNKSFVFFNLLKTNAALGAQGVGLTPEYSLAVDPKWIPYGTPAWLSTTVPTEDNQKMPFNRLMIAQDTGGAIRGTVRGDVFWGTGNKASYMANHMQEKGRYWLLLPRPVAAALLSKKK